MSSRRRFIVAVVWLAVGGLIAIGIDPGDPTATETLLRLFVVALTIFLAAVYVLEPWNGWIEGAGESGEE